MNKCFLLIVAMTMAAAVFEALCSQTPAAIKQELQKADEFPVSTAPIGFRTPKELFEKYWNSVKLNDASEYECMTQKCLTGLFEGSSGILTSEMKARIKDGQEKVDQRECQLLEVSYISDASFPKARAKIRCIRIIKSQPVPFDEQMDFILTKTADGWRINSWEITEF